MATPRKSRDNLATIDDLKGDESWRIFRIISEFTEGIDKLSDTGDGVSIFGSARLLPENPYYAQAMQIAEGLAREGFMVISGGGPGIMEAANRGAQAGNGVSVGLNIELPREQHANTYQDISLDFRYFFVRKVMFVRHSIGYVCMPGGFGTLDELFESLTLMQTHKIYRMPIILFGTAFWGGLLDWIRNTLVSGGLISPEDMDYLTVTDSTEEVVAVLRKHRDWKNSMRRNAGGNR